MQIVNSTLCATWFFSACFGGTVLNKVGPAITASLGVAGYIIYTGGLWYFDQTGRQAYPIFGGFAEGVSGIGLNVFSWNQRTKRMQISAGFIFVSMGYIANSYSEEEERGKFITISINLQALGSIIGGIIPLIINKDSTVAAGVPPAVYICFIVAMFIGMIGAFALQPPDKIVREDGTKVALTQPRGFVEEFKANLEIFRDWKLLLMV